MVRRQPSWPGAGDPSRLLSGITEQTGENHSMGWKSSQTGLGWCLHKSLKQLKFNESCTYHEWLRQDVNRTSITLHDNHQPGAECDDTVRKRSVSKTQRDPPYDWHTQYTPLLLPEPPRILFGISSCFPSHVPLAHLTSFSFCSRADLMNPFHEPTWRIQHIKYTWQ